MIDAIELSASFGVHTVLTGISCGFAGREVTAVFGGNGVGKTTLLSILGGVLKPGSGVVRVGRAARRVTSVRSADRARIRSIHMRDALVPAWRVADHFDPSARVTAPWERLAPQLTGDEIVATLSPRVRRMVEIARALDGSPRVILADEPTAGLGPLDREAVLTALAEAAWRGTAVIIATGDPDLVMSWADRVIVLRDGHIVHDQPTATLRRETLVALRSVDEVAPGPPLPRPQGPVRLVLRAWPAAQPITIQGGTIIGFTGSIATGAADLCRAAAWVPVDMPADIEWAVDAGRPAYISVDRDTEWALDRSSVGFNLAIAGLRENAAAGWLAPKEEREIAEALAEVYEIDPMALDAPPATLSRENRLKMVLARLAAANPDTLLLDEPFSGINAATRGFLCRQLRRLAEQGKAIAIYSLEWPDLLACADRVAVIQDDGSLDWRSLYGRSDAAPLGDALDLLEEMHKISDIPQIEGVPHRASA